MTVDLGDFRYRLRLALERKKLAASEWRVAFRCDRLHRCPGCNVCETGGPDA